jgi:hypothetical protein
MRIFLILIVGLLLSNCTNSYVKNKKMIVSENDLQKFVNLYCNKKEKNNNKVIRSCGVAWSKDLMISESKAIFDAKLKIADITQHTLVRNEKLFHKENSKGVSKSYEMNADNQLTEATIAGYKIIHKKVLKEKNGWRTLVMMEYKIS